MISNLLNKTNKQNNSHNTHRYKQQDQSFLYTVDGICCTQQIDREEEETKVDRQFDKKKCAQQAMEQVDISRTMKCAHQKWGKEAERLPNINQIRQRKKNRKTTTNKQS